MFSSFKKVLVIGPHADDGEFGCGGLISKLVKSGSEVHYAVFSTCEESVPNGMPKNILEVELRSSAKLLGILDKNIYLYDYRVRRFNERRQDILEDLIRIRNTVKPDLVLTPASNDIHQDHSTVSIESVRAFKNNTILGYELVWNNILTSNACFISIDDADLSCKIGAISEYKSQGFRSYSSPDFIKALAKVRGVQVDKKYCEMFEVIRWVIGN